MARIVRTTRLSERGVEITEFRPKGGIVRDLGRGARKHPLVAFQLALIAVMGLINPLAAGGLAIFLTGFWIFAIFVFGGFMHARDKARDKREARDRHYMHLPGGILSYQGTLSEATKEQIKKQFEECNKHSTVAVLSEGMSFEPYMPIPDSEDRTESDSIHPPLPPAFRSPAWDVAFRAYRKRVEHEGEVWISQKRLTSGLRDAVDRYDSITEGRAAFKRQLALINQTMDSLSPEGCRYGALLERAGMPTRDERRVRCYDEDEYDSADEYHMREMNKPLVEIPNGVVLDLDQPFKLTTDCRFQHMADHAIVAVEGDRVTRECGVCEPVTRWTERVS